jgi:hypothetical protein
MKCRCSFLIKYLMKPAHDPPSRAKLPSMSMSIRKTRHFKQTPGYQQPA